MNYALHWNNTAPNYDKEIFNVFKNDKKKKLKKYVSKYANKDIIAIDFGCGVGKALPMLSPLFKGVLAVDFSEKCIEKAKSSPHKNVEFKVVNLAGKKVEWPTCDFALCCNVAMSDNIKMNHRIINNVLNALNKGGAAVFVLPSLESVSITAMSLISWFEKEGTEMTGIPKEELENFTTNNPRHLAEGIMNIDNVPTKHYLFTELYALFNQGNFEMQKIDRLEYDWDTEFDSPPKWMQTPYPWDWVVEVKRVK